jgi:hypothetical protein
VAAVKSLLQAAAALEAFLLERRWQYCFIGGIALQRWGQPRLTNDVDVTILSDFGGEAPYVDTLLGAYRGRISDARAFALRHRVLLLESAEGIPIDVALGGIPFERQAVARATRFEFLPGLSLVTCSCEDLIILKAFANRSRDWADLESVMVRQQGELDWAYVWEQLQPLCHAKEAPEIVVRLEQLRDRRQR